AVGRCLTVTVRDLDDLLFMGDEQKQDDRQWLIEQRYRAVLEVLDGSPVSEVAVRYGVSRQSVYSWKARHAAAGIDGLRRAHPRWGTRRIAFEVAQHGVAAAPSRATVHRVLVRNAMVVPQAQQH